jgi:ABC-type Fe3+/spermidine/putrescine transport system ATPase subunit
MSDRVLVMDEGRIQQIATPEDVYLRPANRFVASFLGRCNLLPGIVRAPRANDSVEVALRSGPGSLLAANTDLPMGTEVTIAIRPEAIRLVERTDNGDTSRFDRLNALDATVTEASFLGDHYEYSLTADSIELIAQSQNLIPATTVTAVIEPSACALISDAPGAEPVDRYNAGGITSDTNGNGSSRLGYTMAERTPRRTLRSRVSRRVDRRAG